MEYQEKIKLCDYGCEKESKYQLKNGKWCCSENQNSCINIKNKIRKSKQLIKSLKIDNIEKLCDYGCGNIANFIFKNGKYCCSNHYFKCKNFHKNTILNQTLEQLLNNDSILCSYGCGNIAKYISKNKKKHCCSKNWAMCPKVKRKNSKTNEVKQKGENNARFGVKLSKETKRKIRISINNDRSKKYGQCFPNYNKKACILIDEYGKENGYNFQHAENGGEFYIKELGYWVDGYDKDKNVVIEVDEIHHFDFNGNLKNHDIERENEIKNFLKCNFIRIKNY